MLGGVFLCITGGEALYADMGHFGKGPIRRSWYTIVLPALLLSYAGQTAFVMDKGTVSGNPFFLIAPGWAIYPLVVLAAVATIIASQAIITGSFSMTRQAMQLGWLPGVTIRQTSDRVYGQIYVPAVNWLLMIGDRRHHHRIRQLGSAGGRLRDGRGDDHAAHHAASVQGHARRVEMACIRRPVRSLGVPGGGLSFFSANLLKIAEGGWLPLTFAGVLFVVMVTWRAGVEAMHAALLQDARVGSAVPVPIIGARDSPHRGHHRIF